MLIVSMCAVKWCSLGNGRSVTAANLVARLGAAPREELDWLLPV